jgi:hypothetical protein
MAVLSGARWKLMQGTVEVAGGRLGRWVSDSRWRFAALTLGHVVLAVDERALAGLRAHEREHVLQYERWGVLFAPAYVMLSLWQVLRGADPYRANRFERQAYAVAGWQGDDAPVASQEPASDA